MHRRHVLLTGFACFLMAQPVYAVSFADRVIEDLQRKGFDKIDVSRTLLGRTRIVAQARDGRREIVLNPRTGEILRDLWTQKPSSTSPSSDGSLVDQGGNRTGGGHGESGGGGSEDNGGGHDGGGEDHDGED